VPAGAPAPAPPLAASFTPPPGSFESAQGPSYDSGRASDPRPFDAGTIRPYDFGRPAPLPTLPPLVDAFTALLAAEQASPAPAAAPLWPALPQPAAPVTDDLVEKVAARVLERLTDRVVQETVAEKVSAVAERLVREEIERIKSAIK
jgi:hypothetical protein